MAYYVERMDSMTQATDVYAAVETGVIADTPGPVPVPTGFSKLAQIIALVLNDGAQAADTGNVFSLEVSGNAVRAGAPHELPVCGHSEAEIGTAASGVQYTTHPFVLNTELELAGPNDMKLRSAFGGTDPGSPEFYITAVLT